MKRISAKKIVLTVFAVILALVLILAAVFFALWHNEIMTLSSLKEVRPKNDAHKDGAVYMMSVKGGFYFDEFIEEGGASNDDELISFITEKLTKGLVDIEMSSPAIGCSSFTAETADGDRVFGRNYDFYQTDTCIVYTEGTNGRHSTITTADLQFIGIDCATGVDSAYEKVMCLAAPYVPLDGINDAGLACGIYMTYQGEGDGAVATDQNTEKPDFTSTTMLRMMLDYAGTVEEAVEIASSYDLHDSAETSFHYMVADANGKSAILEWVADTDATDNDGSARKLVVTYNDDDSNIGDREAKSDYQWITNFIIQPDYYANDSEKLGYDRYNEIYDNLLERDGIVADENDAMSILAAVGRRTWNNDDSNSCTVHSVVYNMTDKTALWVSNENFDDETAVFELSFDE